MGSIFSRLFGSGGTRLKLGQAMGAFPTPGGDISPLYVVFRVENAGGEEVTVSKLYLEPKGGWTLDLGRGLGGGKELPCALSPGEAARFWTLARPLAARLKEEGFAGRPRVKLVVEDAGGNRHTKAFRFRVDEYLELKDR
jgi:hypothetical protein